MVVTYAHSRCFRQQFSVVPSSLARICHIWVRLHQVDKYTDESSDDIAGRTNQRGCSCKCLHAAEPMAVSHVNLLNNILTKDVHSTVSMRL